MKPENSKNINSPLPKEKITLCKVCGAALPRGVERCIICGTMRGSTVPLHAPKSPAKVILDTISPERFHKKRFLIGRIAFIFAFILTLSSLGVGIYEYTSYQNLLTDYNLQHAFLYQQAGANLKINLNSLPEPLQITNGFQSSSATLRAEKSRDYRFLAYLNNQRIQARSTAGSLYLLDLVTLAPNTTAEAGGIKVSEHAVVDFKFSPKHNSLFYLTAEGELYQAEYKSLLSLLGARSIPSTLLDHDVKGLGLVGDDSILYYKGDAADSLHYEKNKTSHEGNSFDLYSLALTKRNSRPTIVATNVYAVLDVSKDHSKIFYTKRTHTPPLVQYDIYLYQQQDVQNETLNNTVLASNVWHVVEANAAKGQVLYLTPLQNMVRYEDLFSDPWQQDDARQAAAPPLTVEEQADGTEELAEETEQESAEERTDSAMSEDELRQLREKFRAHIKSSVRDAKQNDYQSFDLVLYTHTAEESRRIGGPIYHWDTPAALVTADLSAGYAVYIESNPTLLSKINLEEFSSADFELYLETPFDLLPFLAARLPDNLQYTSLVSGDTQGLFSEPGPRYISKVTVFDNDVYFINYSDFESPTGTLYQTTKQNGIFDKVVYLDEDASAIIGNLMGEYTGLLYQTASLDASPTYNLYQSTRDGIREIAVNTGDAASVEILGKERDIVAYFKDFDPLTRTGELTLTRNDVSFFTQANVIAAEAYTEDSFFIVRRETNNNHSLYQYKGEVSSLLDEQLGAYLVFDTTDS